jgi:hypothetical protein
MTYYFVSGPLWPLRGIMGLEKPLNSAYKPTRAHEAVSNMRHHHSRFLCVDVKTTQLLNYEKIMTYSTIVLSEALRILTKGRDP